MNVEKILIGASVNVALNSGIQAMIHKGSFIAPQFDKQKAAIALGSELALSAANAFFYDKTAGIIGAVSALAFAAADYFLPRPMALPAPDVTPKIVTQSDLVDAEEESSNPSEFVDPESMFNQRDDVFTGNDEEMMPNAIAGHNSVLVARGRGR